MPDPVRAARRGALSPGRRRHRGLPGAPPAVRRLEPAQGQAGRRRAPAGWRGPRGGRGDRRARPCRSCGCPTVRVRRCPTARPKTVDFWLMRPAGDGPGPGGHRTRSTSVGLAAARPRPRRAAQLRRRRRAARRVSPRCRRSPRWRAGPARARRRAQELDGQRRAAPARRARAGRRPSGSAELLRAAAARSGWSRRPRCAASRPWSRWPRGSACRSCWTARSPSRPTRDEAPAKAKLAAHRLLELRAGRPAGGLQPGQGDPDAAGRAARRGRPGALQDAQGRRLAAHLGRGPAAGPVPV